MNYYIKVQDRAYGPFATEKLHAMLQRGGLNAESLISTDKQNWREVASFPELIGENRRSAPSASFVDAESDAQASQSAPDWYLSLDGTTGFGPYAFNDIVAFVRSGRANGDALVWRNGENARSINSEPAFSRLFAPERPNSNPAPFVNPSYANPALAVSSTTAKLNARFRFYWLGLVAALVLPMAGAIADLVLAFLGLPLPIFTFGGALLATASLIFAIVSFYTFIYVFWKTLPAGYAPTTPGKAVGFLFIPYFFWYWNFIVFHEGARNANRALTDFAPRVLPQAQISETLALVYAISFIVCPLVAFVVSFPLLNQMRKAGSELSNLAQPSLAP